MPDSGVSRQVVEWLWNNREVVLNQLRKVWRWFKGKKGILILGSGGVGKSTLASILSGKFDFLLDGGGEYVESLNVETHPLSQSPEVEMLVPPGQEARREITWPQLQEQVAAGMYQGVIFVNAF